MITYQDLCNAYEQSTLKKINKQKILIRVANDFRDAIANDLNIENKFFNNNNLDEPYLFITPITDRESANCTGIMDEDVQWDLDGNMYVEYTINLYLAPLSFDTDDTDKKIVHIFYKIYIKDNELLIQTDVFKDDELEIETVLRIPYSDYSKRELSRLVEDYKQRVMDDINS